MKTAPSFLDEINKNHSTLKRLLNELSLTMQDSYKEDADDLKNELRMASTEQQQKSFLQKLGGFLTDIGQNLNAVEKHWKTIGKLAVVADPLLQLVGIHISHQLLKLT